MAGWTSKLKADPTDWLLEESNPSVRYLTLTNLLDRRPTQAEVKQAKADMTSERAAVAVGTVRLSPA